MTRTVAEPGIDLRIARTNGWVRDEAHRGPVGEVVTAGPRGTQGGIREARGELVEVAVGHRPQVPGMHAHAQALGHACPIALDDPPQLHRALDASFELDGLEARAEHARRIALEEALEESLQIGEDGHGGAGVYQ